MHNEKTLDRNSFHSGLNSDVTTIKIIVVGPVSVGKKFSQIVSCTQVMLGKTTCIRGWVEGHFDRNLQATVGVDFGIKKKSINHVPYQFAMWDIAGQERLLALKVRVRKRERKINKNQNFN